MLSSMRGTGEDVPVGYLFFTSAVALSSVVVVGLAFGGKWVKFLIPVGGAFLLGGGMGPFRSVAQKMGTAMIVLPVGDAFGQILLRLADQWPLKLAFACGAAALCATYLLMRRPLENNYSLAKAALFLCIVVATGAGIFFARDSIGSEAFKHGKEVGASEGYLSVAKIMPDARAFLQVYVHNRERLHAWDTIHIWANMPGKTLLYYGFLKIGLEEGGINAANIILCALTAVPLFFVARRLLGARVAGGAAILFFIFPGLPSAFPSFNAMTAFFAMTGVWLALICLGKRDPLIGGATGCYLALLFFYEPLPFVLAVFLVPYIWRALRADAAAAIGTLAGVALGVAAVFGAVYLWSGASIFKMTLDTIDCAARFNLSWKRDYWAHLLVNVVELGGAVGWITLVLWAFGFVRGAKEIFTRGGSFAGRLFVETPAAAVCVFALFIMMLALDLSGVNRGETGRLWIFLMPLTGASAVWGAEKLNLKFYMPFLCGFLWLEGILVHAKELAWPF
jgi:hypothetical protein